MSRASGVDVITGDGLAEALVGAECVIDIATGPSPEQDAATEFFIVEFVLKRTAGSLAVGGLGHGRPIVRYSPRAACEISSSIVRR